MIRTFSAVSEIRWGFDQQNVLVIDATLPDTMRTTPERAQFAEDAITALHGLPDVVSAAEADGVPGQSRWYPRGLALGGTVVTDEGPVGMWVVSRGYFETLGIPVLEGREFRDGDDAAGPRAVILSRSLAKRVCPTGACVGLDLDLLELKPAMAQVPGDVRASPGWWSDLDRWNRQGRGPYRVVGVVGDVRMFGLSVGPQPAFYVDHRQQPPSSTMTLAKNVQFVVRYRGSAAGVAAKVRDRLRALNPELHLEDLTRLEDLVARAVGLAPTRRLVFIVCVALAVFALLLAGLGFQAMVAHDVTARREEFALKMSLGLSPAALAVRFVREHVMLATAGVAFGAAAGLNAASLLDHVLVGVGPHDPASLTMALVVLYALAFAVCVPAALRAARVPMNVLQH